LTDGPIRRPTEYGTRHARGHGNLLRGTKYKRVKKGSRPEKGQEREKRSNGHSARVTNKRS